MNAKGTSLIFLVLIFWSCITLLFDNATLVPAVRQYIAASYPSTDGTILSSAVSVTSGDEGDSYNLDVAYTYQVAGQIYEGPSYSYDKFSSFGSSGAYDFVAKHPAGTKLPVFYNPKNPGDAVLTTGLRGQHLFMFTFMAPFNAVMLGFWFFGLNRVRARWFKPIAGGVKIISRPRQTIARLTEASPIMVALFTIGLLAFLSVFLVLLFKGDHPPLRFMLILWAGIVTIAISASLWHQYKILRGKYDLIIDDLASTVELPLTHGRKTRVRLPFSSVQGLHVERIVQPDNEGGPPSYSYAPTLDINDGTLKSNRLVKWRDEEKAHDFVEWLRAKLPRKPAPARPLAGRL